MKLLVNGKVVSEPLALPFSLSFIRGDGLFETILTIDEKAVAWDRHRQPGRARDRAARTWHAPGRRPAAAPGA